MLRIDSGSAPSMSYDYDLVCVGSGPAGQRAAVQAAKLGHRAAVVEKRRSIGGVSVTPLDRDEWQRLLAEPLAS